MNIDNYFKFEKDIKYKSTFHCTKYYSISDYETLSFNPKKRNSVYISNDVTGINAKGERKPIMRFTSLSHITGIFIPDLNNLSYAFGDIKGTKDLIQFLFYPDIKEPAIIEMFIRAGEKNLYNLYNNLFFENAFNDDFEYCREQAKDFIIIPKPKEGKILELKKSTSLINR